MKYLKYLSILCLIVCQTLVASSAQSEEVKKLLTMRQALTIAEMTPEVEGLYSLGGGFLFNCIEKEVLRPCETDWVSCVDNAWVARFTVGSRCPVKHDGRLNIYIVIDDRSGNIISRFPEAQYFKDPAYCLENYECLFINNPQSRESACYNFIYGQISGNVQPNSACICQNNRCEMALEKK